ncbi:MAG: M56 family peptidase [Mycolicibacterium mageritense]|nr:MAG: M56 family peptidase [Mycolicibacterium mageritense]
MSGRSPDRWLRHWTQHERRYDPGCVLRRWAPDGSVRGVAVTAVTWWAIAGVAAGVVSPAVLRELMRRGASAAALLCTWAVMVCLVTVALAVPALTELAHRCWLAVHPETGRIDTVAGYLSAVALSLAAARGGWQLCRSGRSRHRLHSKHFQMAWVLNGDRPRRGAVLWLPVTQPLAYSLAGQPPLVVATAGLHRVFDDTTIEAVLAHEHAHVNRGHHRLVALADTVAAGIGWLPLMGQAPSMVRTLVELDADAHAARTFGHRRLATALRTLQHMATPPTALGIAGECTELRLARLTVEHSGGAGRLGGLAAGCGAALVVGVAGLLTTATVIALVSCTAT